jgi:threonine/homoserine/homoserine lactone efflux protein
MTLELLITSFIVVVSPGTGVLYTLATGLSCGSRGSIVAARLRSRITSSRDGVF